MISLVVIIIVTIILIGIAVSAGYVYLEKANEFKRFALSQVIGQVAASRQNDMSAGASNRFYEGYLFDISKDITYQGKPVNKYSLMENLPTEDGPIYNESGELITSTDGIPNCLQKPGAIWYMIDAESATNLNADGADDLLSKNISYTGAYTDDELVRVVLVDYSTGEAYYVTMPAGIAKASINNSAGDCPKSPDGKHRFTIATCTEDSKCIYCGTIGIRKFNHPEWYPATCEEPMKCKKCGLEKGEKLGHLYIRNTDVPSFSEDYLKKDLILVENGSDADNAAWVTDVIKHWHECIRCGAKDGEDVHSKGYVSVDDVYHEEVCSICGWTSARVEHTFDKPISIDDSTGNHNEHQHKVVCRACKREVRHDEIIPSGNPSNKAWFADHNEVHYRICSVENCTCNNYLTVSLNGSNVKVAFKEQHYDYVNNDNPSIEEPDSLCDVCGRNNDSNPPVDFNDEDAGAYAKVIATTTSTIKVEAYTIDKERPVSSEEPLTYTFGIYDEVTKTVIWDTDHPYVATSPDEKATYTFTELEANTTYEMYVKATDANGNTNKPYKIIGTTAEFPEFAGLINWPDHYVAPGHEVKVKEIETDLDEDTLDDIRLSYYQDDVWITKNFNECIEIDEIKDIVIKLKRDNDAEGESGDEVLKFKFVDSQGNESETWSYTTDLVDAVPPKVAVEAKDNETSQLSHLATIILSDRKSGIVPDTEVRYAWSTSSTVPPTNYTSTYTKNLDVASRTTFDVQTPTDVVGTYYLWIDRGIPDAVGNKTPDPFVDKNVAFIVDDTIATLTEITMLNVTPSVPGEQLFVKTDGTVTVTFKASKPLGPDPVVKLNGVVVDSIVHSDLVYTCRLKITDSFEEGTLELMINGVVSRQGKLSDRIYTNADIYNGKGPVYYDKTLPLLVYIPKYPSGDSPSVVLEETNTITYYPNTTDTVTNMPDVQIKARGFSIAISSKIPDRIAYDFKGWTTVNGGETVEYRSNDRYEANRDLVLYAVWEDARRTVTFDKQGGTGGSDSVIAIVRRPMPSAVMPTKTCHIFNGYYATASGGTQYYTETGESARNYDIPTDSTLYAGWTPNHKIKSTYETDANQHWKICSVCSIIMVNKENHSWNGGVITTSPTCTATGIRTYTCTVCGRTRTETVAALGHSPKSTYENDANQHWKICSRCSAITTAKANHNWNGGTVTSSATCTAAGNRKYTCNTCGRTKNESIPAIGHSAGGWTQGNNNNHTKYCTRCGEFVQGAPHNWVVNSASGGTIASWKCTVCGRIKGS